MRVDAIVFDYGGTLTAPVSAEEVDPWRAVARYLAADREDALTTCLKAAEQAFWATTSTHCRSATITELIASAAADVDLRVPAVELRRAAVCHRDAWAPFERPDPSAASTLRALRDGGLRIALLSNTHWPRAFHERFLEQQGLIDFLNASIFTSELPYQKPHATAFRSALKALDVRDPSRAVFVGDRPLDDIHGASRAGMRTVLKAHGWERQPGFADPDAVIVELPEIIPLVEGWS